MAQVTSHQLPAKAVIRIDGKQFESRKGAAAAYDIPVYVLSYRLRSGWDLGRALKTPVRKCAVRKQPYGWRSKRIFLRGANGRTREYRSIRAACERLGVKQFENRIYDRIRRGWSVQKAFDEAGRNLNDAVIRVQTATGLQEFRSLRAACAGFNQTYNRVRSSLQRGWSLEEALGVTRRSAARKPNPNQKAVDFVHKGVRYSFPSIAAACRHFQKKPASIRRYVDDLGWSYPQAFSLTPHPSHRKKTFGSIYLITDRVTGMKYVGQTKQTLEQRFGRHVKDALKHEDVGNTNSLAEAIRRHGHANFSCELLTTCTTQSALNKKEILFIANLKTRHPDGYNIRKGGSGLTLGKAVDVAGVHYPSLSEAARAHGIDPRLFWSRLSSGWTERQALGIDGAPASALTNKRSVRVLCEGGPLTFPTVAECCRHFGCKASIVNDRLRRGWTPDEAVGLVDRAPPSGAPIPVTIRVNGETVEYPSINSAAKAHDLSPLVVRKRIQKLGWSPEEALEIVSKSRGTSITVLVSGERIEHATIAEAARQHNLKPTTVEKRLKLGWTPEQALGIAPR